MRTLAKPLAIAALVFSLAPASAEAKKAPAKKAPAAKKAATTSVVLAPLSSLSVAKPKALVAIEKTIEAGLAKVPNLSLVNARSAAAKADKAKRPELRTCEGAPACLAELGVLVGTQYVIHAEVGGLGESQIIYLKLIATNTGKEVRSTLIELASGGDSAAESLAAATRLLAPETYLGKLALSTKVKGATIYLDGQKRGTTPSKTISASVGSHAIRITHPEHRDFVRFIDLKFGEQTKVTADLQLLPGVSRRLALEGVIGGGGAALGPVGSTPWYYRWYSIAGGATAITVTSAVIFALIGDKIDSEDVRDL